MPDTYAEAGVSTHSKRACGDILETLAGAAFEITDTYACPNRSHYPVGLCAPLYLQNVLGASAVITGLVLAVLPLSTALASFISGRLADRFDAALIACLGLLFIFGGIVYYSRLETDRN